MGDRALINTKITLSITTTVRNNILTTLNASRVATAAIGITKNISMENGVDANQVDRGWDWSGLLTSGASVVLDLSNFTGWDLGAGDGCDALGQPMTPILEVATIVISNENAMDAAGYLEIVPDASNGWTGLGSHTVALGNALLAQGILWKHQPGTFGLIVTSSNRRLKLTANGGNVNYYIGLLGRHDDDASSSSSSQSSSSSSSNSSSSS